MKLFAAAMVLSLFTSVAPAKGATAPNIVVIVGDDLGYADVGCQGQSKDVKTPNVDSIAANGVRFTNGYVSCPVCSPTRRGLMTGRYQQRFGHEFNPGPQAADNFGLPLDQVTLPQALKARGYATGMVGKWHLGNKPEFRPPQRGFDEFYGFLGGAHTYNAVGNGKNPVLRGDTPVPSVTYLTDDFGREASDFIERHHGGAKPFFLYMPFNAVHSPPQVTEKYLERFPQVKDQTRRILLAKLLALDDAVGQILGKIREHKLEENTLIVFISDNGGPTAGNGSRNDPLTGYKGEVKEGGIREPFMMQWKGHLPAGKVYDKPVISLDIFPTALAVAGAETPKGVKFDGVNLIPFLAGEKDGTPHEQLYWRFGPQWAIREGNYKLRRAEDEKEAKLFDLSSDISEKKDLSAEQPEVVKRLREEYEKWNAQLERPRWIDSRNASTRIRRRPAAAATQSDDE